MGYSGLVGRDHDGAVGRWAASRPRRPMGRLYPG